MRGSKCGTQDTKKQKQQPHHELVMTPKRARDAAASGDVSDASAAKRQQRDRSSRGDAPTVSGGDSVADDDLARLQQETLRISNEMLRSENEQLQVEVEILEESSKKLEKKLAASQQRVQVLESDLARWYKTQKKDAELKQAEHAAEIKMLQDQLDAVVKHSELPLSTSSTPASVAIELRNKLNAVAGVLPLVSPHTAQEMDSFLAACMQWQSNLTTASLNLEKQVSKIEADEVKSVLSNLVASVEIMTRDEQVTEKERELEAMRLSMMQQQHELECAMQKMTQERDEADAFEALERRVLEDRVAELEVQYTQNKLREFEKDEEITNLRAEQDELNVTSCVIPKQEWEAHLAEHQRLGEEADEWRQKSEEQTSEVTRLQEDVRSATLKMQELEGKVQIAQAQEDTRSFEMLEKRILEERIVELEAQLQLQVREQQQLQNNNVLLAEQEQQRTKLTEELEDAQLQLSVAQAESNVKKNEVARLLNDKSELKKQVKTLASDLKKVILHVEECKAQVSSERARSSQLAEEIKKLQKPNEALTVQKESRATEEQTRLEQELRDLKEQEQVRVQDTAEKAEVIKRLERKEQELSKQLKQQQTERDDEASREMLQLKEQNAQLLAERERMHRAHEDSLDIETVPSAVDSTIELARLTHEKQAMQDFFRCYFETAEKKCRQLMHELSQREAQTAHQRQHAKDSCELLQQQVEFCDNSVRRAILKVVSTLERIA